MPVSKPSAISKAAVLKELGDDDKTHVTRTTVEQYVKDKSDNETENKTTTDKNNDESRAAFTQGIPPYMQDKGAPQDRLAQMFTDMKEAEDEENEIFIALITRLPDLLTDNFRRSCMQSMSFAPLQITSNYLLSFIPLLQKHNGNSGGRFKIVICDINGEPLDIGISGLLVSDPILEEKPITDTATGNNDTLALVDRIMQQSDQRFAELVKLMRENTKEDEFTQLAKEKLKQDILNPKHNESQFNPEAAIERAMTSIAVTEAMAKGFAKMFDRGESADKEQGLLATLLNNEMIVDRASHLLENVTNNIAAIANNVATRPTQPQQPTVTPNPNTGYPPLPPNPTPQPPPMEQEPIMTVDEQEKLIKSIIEELESDRPLNDDNAFLIDLKEKHATQYQGLSVACKVMPFDSLIEQLEATFPAVFDEFYSETEEKDDETGEPIIDLNDRGKRIEARLKEFYEYMKQKT